MSKQLKFAILGGLILLLIITGRVNARLAVQRNFCAVQTLLSISKQHSLAQDQTLLGCPSYFQGLLALTQGQSEIAENRLQLSFTTAYSPFARLHLIRMWVKLEQWQKIQNYLATSEWLDDTFLNRIVASRIPYSDKRELSRWLNVLQSRQPTRLLFYAQELLEVQRFAEAEEWADHVKVVDQIEEAKLLKGKSIFYQQQFARASLIFASCYQRQPQNVEISYWYGRSLLYAGKSYEAIAPLEHSIQSSSSSTNPWYLYELSNAYIAVGRCNDAKIVMQLAFKYKPDVEIASRLSTTQSALANCK